MKTKLAFYSSANYSLSRGVPQEAIYDMVDTHDVTKDEVTEYLKTKAKSKAIKGALTMGASKEEQEAIYNTLDQKIITRYKNVVTLRRGENTYFYNYEDGYYKSLPRIDMEDLVDSMMAQLNLLDYRTSRRKVKDTIDRVSSLLARTKGRHFTDKGLQDQPWRLNLKNGLLDTKDYTLHSHTSDYFSTVQVPFDYDPEAECPMFDEFIKTVSNQVESTGQMIQEMFGYCIGEGNPNHKVFYLYGDTARNGKSTTAKLICGLLGWDNVATLSLSQLAGENSSILTSIVDKQLNFSDEVSSKYIESSRLTTMSAEGMVEINPKYERSYLYQVRAKFIITCNDLPQFQDAQGMKYRMITIPFDHHFEEKDRILRYEHILLEKEGPGILNWAIEGAKLLRTNTVFSVNEQSKEDMDESLLQNNTVYAYLYDNFEYSGDVEVEMDDLYGERLTKENEPTMYRLYCQEKGVKEKSFRVFCKELKRFAKETGKIDQRKRKGGSRYYVGLTEKKDDNF